MTALPSSTIPAMPSQCLPRTFSSRLAKTCSRRAIWPCVSSRWLSNAWRSFGVRRRLRQFRQRLGQLLLAVVCVPQFVDECVVERACFSHVVSPRDWPRRLARAANWSLFTKPMLRDRRDQPRSRSPCGFTTTRPACPPPSCDDVAKSRRCRAPRINHGCGEHGRSVWWHGHARPRSLEGTLRAIAKDGTTSAFSTD